MSNQRNVENTGSSMATDGTNYWQAVVWDGDTPGLAVFEMPANRIYSNPLGGGFLKVHDPDVVINYEFADKILVAYEAFTGTTTDVFYEIYSLSTAGISLVQGPTQISTRPLSRHANVDANFIGEAVIVWESNGADIYATTVDLNAPFPITVNAGSNIYSSPFGFNLIKPDVTIHGNSINPTGDIYITYICDNPGNAQRVEHAFDNYNFFPSFSLIAATSWFSAPQIIDAPRINSAWANEYMFTYTVRDAGTNVSEVHMEIPAYSYTGVENSFATSLLPWKNARSVVDYNGDVCLVCWEFDDSSPVFYRGVNELICHHYYHDGSVFPTSFPDYSAVADGVHGSVSALSLCGALGLAGFAWFENAADEIRIKHSITQGANYRRPADNAQTQTSLSPKSEVTIFPNPSNDILTIKGILLGNYEVIVTDGRGLTVKKSRLTQEQMFLDLSDFQSGVYFIHIVNEFENHSLRFVKL